MRASLLIAVSLPVAACAGMAPATLPVPITPHVVSTADYPPDSVRLREEGIASLRYVVIEDGTVGDVQVLKSSGFARLDEASVALVKSKWRFRPATRNGRPVRSPQITNVSFVLSPPWSYSMVYALSSASVRTIALNPDARALIAPLYAVYEDVERRQSTWPPPKDDKDRLLRMAEIDRAGRVTLSRIDLSSLTPEQRAAALKAAWVEIHRHDVVNQTALKAMLPPEGWFLKSQYGQEAVQAAFDIVYHAVNDRELQHSTLAALEPLVAKGEIRARAYGMLYDRVASQDGRPQRYGSEVACKNQRWVLVPLEDPENVDLWRTTMGFDLRAEESIAQFANSPPCG